jgi:hypothetical protein
MYVCVCVCVCLSISHILNSGEDLELFAGQCSARDSKHYNGRYVTNSIRFTRALRAG